LFTVLLSLNRNSIKMY